MVCRALQYFFHSNSKRHVLRGKKLLNVKCVYLFSHFFFHTRFILRYYQKCMLVFMQSFEKHSDIKFHENPSSGAEALHVDRQTDMTKIIVAFHNSAIAYKKNTKPCIIFHCIAMQYLDYLWWILLPQVHLLVDVLIVRICRVCVTWTMWHIFYTLYFADRASRYNFW